MSGWWLAAAFVLFFVLVTAAIVVDQWLTGRGREPVRRVPQDGEIVELFGRPHGNVDVIPKEERQ